MMVRLGKAVWDLKVQLVLQEQQGLKVQPVWLEHKEFKELKVIKEIKAIKGKLVLLEHKVQLD